MIHKIIPYLFGRLPAPPDATKYYDGSGKFSTPPGTSGITSLSGDVVAVGPGASPSTIANDAVVTVKVLDKNITYAKIQDVAASRLLGRSSTTAGVVGEVQLGTNLSFSGTTLNASSGGASTTANYVVSTTEAGLPNSRVLIAGGNITFTTSTTSITINSSGGGSGNNIWPITNPVNGDFSWVNQGGASVVVNSSGGIYTNSPANASGSLRYRVKAAPATPYVITAGFLWVGPVVDFHQFGLCWRDSASGKIISAHVLYASTITTLFPTWISQKFTNETTFNSTYLSNSLLKVAGNMFWLRISDDGINRKFSYSPDGYNFTTLHTVGRTDFLTANQVGFGGQPENGTYDLNFTLISWIES